jgi:hypothetical protein
VCVYTPTPLFPRKDTTTTHHRRRPHTSTNMARMGRGRIGRRNRRVARLMAERNDRNDRNRRGRSMFTSSSPYPYSSHSPLPFGSPYYYAPDVPVLLANDHYTHHPYGGGYGALPYPTGFASPYPMMLQRPSSGCTPSMCTEGLSSKAAAGTWLNKHWDDYWANGNFHQRRRFLEVFGCMERGEYCS